VVSLKGDTQIRNTPLFTPAAIGVYRYSAYMSVVGPSISGWILSLLFEDLSGINVQTTLDVTPGASNKGWGNDGLFMFSPAVGVPVTFQLEQNGNPPLPYIMTFTIEQLQ